MVIASIASGSTASGDRKDCNCRVVEDVKRRYGDSTATLRRAGRPNEVWTYDFLEGRTERGGKLRMLTVLDEYTRECLAIHVARSISSRQVIEVLDWLFLVRVHPTICAVTMARSLSPMRSRTGCGKRSCHTLYITPGSPWENPFIESFNGTFRSECLDRWLFANGREAQLVIEQWRQEYNHRRPHSSLGYVPPAVFADQARLPLEVV